MYMDSVVSFLISVFMSLALLALVVRIASMRVAAALALGWLLFCVIHPVLRQQILAVAAQPMAAILPLILILLGLRIIVRRKIR